MNSRKFLIFRSIGDAFTMMIANSTVLLKGWAFLGLIYAIGVLLGVMLDRLLILPQIQQFIPMLQKCGTNIECQKEVASGVFALLKARPEHFVITGMALACLMVLKIFIYLSFMKFSVHVYDGNSEQLGMFPSFSQMIKFVIAMVLCVLIFLGGFILLVIPAFYWGFRFSFFSLAIIDKNAGIIESLKISWRITKGKVWRLIGLYATLGLAALPLMLILSFVGLPAFFADIITLPISSFVLVFVYRQLSTMSICPDCGQTTANSCSTCHQSVD